MAYFTIHPGNDHITLDSTTRSGSMVLSVQNKTGAARRVRAFVTVAEPAQAGWYTVKEPVQQARVDETLQFPVDVTVAPDVEAGSYGFRLKVVAEDDPDDVHEESQQLTVEVPPAPPKKFPWWIVAVVVAVLAVVGVLVGLLLSRGGGVVAVPDLTGQALEEAEQSLDEAGLELGEVTPQPSGEQPEGHVLSQDPAVDTEVEEGSAVDVVVSTGLVTVPGIAGSTVEEAEAALADAGLVLGDVVGEVSPEPAGEILTQDPEAGVEVEEGTAVDVVLSSGPPEERIAHYPLDSDGEDALGLQGPMTLANTTFSNGGVFCNGVYVNNDGGCNIITPILAGFDFRSFSIGVEFQVADAADRPVIVGGNRFRWIGFLLNADRTVTLLHNNRQLQSCGGSYALGTWQQGMLTYDGTQGQLYLNGELRCTVPFALNHGNDANVGVNDPGPGRAFRDPDLGRVFQDPDLGRALRNLDLGWVFPDLDPGRAFRGWIRNLDVYDEAIVP